jgi:hypothetical protein
MRAYFFIIVFFLLAILPHQLQAQNPTETERANISGIILDAKNREPLTGVNIILSLQGDTSRQISGISTDEFGRFRFAQLVADTYNLRLSYLGYETMQVRNIRLGKDLSYPLDTIRLKESATDLGDIVVEADIIAVQMFGDTIQYNAAAYKANPDAMVEDLIKKMPGIQIENGVVKAQGEVVKKITIDGKEFFGDDVAAAIKNIPASEVDKIQIYNSDSDKAAITGISDATPEKSMNIVSKSGNIKGGFGKVSAAYGTKNRYNVGGNYNYFAGDRRFSIIGRANNVNEPGFSFEDITISDGVNDPIDLWGNTAFNYTRSDGINSSQLLGFNFNDKWGKKTNVSMAYTTGFSQNINGSKLARRYLPNANDGKIQSYSEIADGQARQLQHRATMKLEIKPDSISMFNFKSNFSSQNGRQAKTFDGLNLLDSSFLSSTQSLNNGSDKQYKIDVETGYTRQLGKPRRSMDLYFDGEIKHNNFSSLQISENIFATNATSATQLNLLRKNLVNEQKGGVYLAYTEPLGKQTTFQFSYSENHNFAQADRNTNAFVDSSNTYSRKDSLLSNNFDTRNSQRAPTVGFNFERDKKRDPADSISREPLDFSFGVYLSYRHSQLKAEQNFPDSAIISRSFDNLLPAVYFRLKINKNTNFDVHYNNVTKMPTVGQLQNVVNNQNPLFLSVGNAELKQSFSYDLNISLFSFQPAKGSSFSFFNNLSVNQNSIGNSIVFAQNDTLIDNSILLRKGGQLSRKANLGTAINNTFAVFYSFPLKFIKSTVNLNAISEFSRLPALINTEKSYSNNNKINFYFNLNSNISENFDLSLGSSINFNRNQNRQFAVLNNTSLNMGSWAYLVWNFGKRFLIASNFSHKYYNGMSAGFNRNVFMLGGSIGVRFFKGNRGQLKLSITDALAQNIDIERTMHDIYVEDRSTTILRRYVMLNFVYNLRRSDDEVGGDKMILLGG